MVDNNAKVETTIAVEEVETTIVVVEVASSREEVTKVARDKEDSNNSNNKLLKLPSPSSRDFLSLFSILLTWLLSLAQMRESNMLETISIPLLRPISDRLSLAALLECFLMKM